MSSLTKHERIDIFAREIILGKSQSDAYRKAYPSSKNWKPDTVHNKASKFARTEQVLARVQELRKEVKTDFSYRLNDILEIAYTIATLNPGQVMDLETGKMRAIKDIDPKILAAMSDVEFDVRPRIVNAGDVELADEEYYIRSFKQPNKLGALKTLIEHKYREQDKPFSNPDADADSTANIDTVQLARKALLLAYQGEHKQNEG